MSNPPAYPPHGMRPWILASLLAVAANCVSLSKPYSVQQCADKGNCSNGTPDGDAASDQARDTTSPDLRPADLANDTPGDRDGGDARSADTRDVADASDASEDITSGDTADLRVADEPVVDLPLTETGRETEPEPGAEPRAEPAPEPPPEPGRDGGEAGSGNCITRIIEGGYAYGTAPPCSACKDNSTPLVTKCEGMLDCLAPPSTKADMTRCLNQVAGSDPVNKCVSALIAAGCPNGF